MNLQKVKAVVFDLDGTLLDTVKDIGASANFALRRYGMHEYPINDYCAFVGHGIRELFAQIVPEGKDNPDFEAALAVYLAHYPENCTANTDFFPGIPELLTRLAAVGYRLAILSNKTEKTTQRIVSQLLADHQFAFVWGNNQSRPLKPAIDAGKLACNELGLAPEEILYFGDGDTDMEFGSKMGFVTVGCTWGYRNRQQLLDAGAHMLVDTTQELLAALGLG